MADSEHGGRQAGLIVQYLDWAMGAAQKLANPDCRRVTIRINLETGGTITSFVKKDSPDPVTSRELLNMLEAVVVGMTGPRFNRERIVANIRKVIDRAKEVGTE